ncbi:hypothetical protein BpHYR1_037366 [Brachionus plicatilis]|uniref:Uncharacterized protein n=1 Tax=Brachionus plicatilis TaxID=10195 RepID=A0A3M7STL8_BRAPC|nr:hypothetical protein BpHYR1_037366 [Brachionus plicatilis]
MVVYGFVERPGNLLDSLEKCRALVYFCQKVATSYKECLSEKWNLRASKFKKNINYNLSQMIITFYSDEKNDLLLLQIVNLQFNDQKNKKLINFENFSTQEHKTENKFSIFAIIQMQVSSFKNSKLLNRFWIHFNDTKRYCNH